MHDTLSWAFPLDPSSLPQIHPELNPLYENRQSFGALYTSRERPSFPPHPARIIVRELENTEPFVASIVLFSTTPFFVSLALDDGSSRNVSLNHCDEITDITAFFGSPHKKGWHALVNNVSIIASPPPPKLSKLALGSAPSACLFCTECQSSSRDDLQKHLNFSHANQLRNDPACIAKSHWASRLAQCRFCYLAFSAIGVSGHESNCSDRPVQCPIATCAAFMTTRGTTAAAHLKHHLIEKHTLADATFDPATTKLLKRHKLD